MSKQVCALYSRAGPYFTGAKPHRVLAGAETIFICRCDSEKPRKCLYKVSSPLRHSSTVSPASSPILSPTSHSARDCAAAIFRNGSYRRFRHRAHCRRVRSFWPFYSVARSVAIRRGIRSISSLQYERAHSPLPAIAKLDFAVRINRRRRRLANDASLARWLAKRYPFLSSSVSSDTRWLKIKCIPRSVRTPQIQVCNFCTFACAKTCVVAHLYTCNFIDTFHLCKFAHLTALCTRVNETYTANSE